MLFPTVLKSDVRRKALVGFTYLTSFRVLFISRITIEAQFVNLSDRDTKSVQVL